MAEDIFQSNVLDISPVWTHRPGFDHTPAAKTLGTSPKYLDHFSSKGLCFVMSKVMSKVMDGCVQGLVTHVCSNCVSAYWAGNSTSHDGCKCLPFGTHNVCFMVGVFFVGGRAPRAAAASCWLGRLITLSEEGGAHCLLWEPTGHITTGKKSLLASVGSYSRAPAVPRTRALGPKNSSTCYLVLLPE